MRKIKKKTMEILKKKGNVLIILALLIVAIVSFYFYKTNGLKNAQKPNTSDGEISLLYFYSDAMGTSTISKVCPATDNINWEVANLVLSDYMEYGEGSSTQEFGPAEIQRNFEENCDRNMKIYNDKLTKNPTMECDMSESSGAYNNCVDGLYQSFKKLQESKYKEYLKKLDGFINETELCQAFSYDSIKEGIIKWHSQVDSWGGVPVAGEEVASALRNAQKPTVAMIRSVGASAAYMAATGAKIIFASQYSDVGSIGVTASYTDESLKNQKEGIVYNELTTGKFKDMMSSGKPLTADEKALIVRDLTIVHNNFVKAVATNRDLPVDKVRALADGSSMLGEMALQNRLIDRIGGFTEVEQYLEKVISEKPNVCW